MHEDRRWTLLELERASSIEKRTVHRILRNELHQRQIAARWVPHPLMEAQRWLRYAICSDHFARMKQDGSFKACGSPVVKVSDQGRQFMSSSPAQLKTRPVGQRCSLNLSRAETSSLWCGVVVRRGSASLGVVLVTSPWFKMTWSVAKSP
ncbi:uncharacterized protein TNCV_4950961 [Trichonephila clavipes]|nr:uncharacterized protein TNCV_4950961 [Trichonephila clavipes]